MRRLDYNNQRDSYAKALESVEAALDELRSALDIRKPDYARLARGFCELDDDTQAKFFVEVARLMGQWGAGKAESQAFYIGRHLRTCECATDAARELIRNIAAAEAYNE